jgi:alpha-glucuronidase
MPAETGYDAWLRYRPIDEPAVRQIYDRLPRSVVTLRRSPALTSAQSEIVRAVKGMLGRTLRASEKISEDAIVLATSDSLTAAFPALSPPKNLTSDG